VYQTINEKVVLKLLIVFDLEFWIEKIIMVEIVAVGKRLP
jgi:hypothetical protein